MNDDQLSAEFPLGPDSLRQPGVPQGKVEKFTFSDSKVFPGTVRDYYVYVPASYDPAIPSCVIICQDGHDHLTPVRRWQIPTVLDNLIHRGEIPTCIGIFINPGSIPGARPRFNRGFEYDSVSDRYARFLLEEILPEVGRRYHLTQDGGSRLIMGGSSGAACAFNAAWHRPDAFQRVLSIVGSYTAFRGGNTQAALVRLTEPKPLRLFLESGEEDMVVFAGSWWPANLDMLAALEYSGYEVNHAWARHAGHNDYHGASILPDALRWLWQGHPHPIKSGVNSRQPVARILIPGEGWREVAAGVSAGCLATSAKGEVVFASESGAGIFQIEPDGRAREIAREADRVTDLFFAPDGSLLACQPGRRRITAFDEAGRMTVAIADIDAQSVCCAANGNRYVADPVVGGIWLVTTGGDRTIVDRGVATPRCVRLTAGQDQLIVNDARGRMANLFAVRQDGTLADGAPFFRLNLPGESCDSGAEQIAPHVKGWTCFATSLGLQVADAGGAVCAIIPTPGPGRAAGVAFGGPDFSELHVTCGSRLYRRRILAPDNLWC